MKKIFITGATGFIGNKLANFLAEKGHTVHALVRSPERAINLNPPRIKIFKGDITNYDSIINAMRGCQEVYHVAALVSLWLPDPRTHYKVNVGGTRRVMDAASDLHVEKVVYTSSGSVLPSRNGYLVNETDENSVPAFTHYGRSKQKAEQLIKYYHSLGLNVVTVIPTRVYGPGLNTKTNASSRLIKRGCEGKLVLLPGTRDPIANWAFIDDVVQGHINAMKYGKAGERYILGGDNASLRDVFNIVHEISGNTFPMLSVPAPILKLFAMISLFIAKLTGIPPLITPDFVDKLLSTAPRNINKAVCELKYNYTPLKEGVSKTISWLKNSNHEKQQPQESSTHGNYALVTGASQGIGKCIAEKLAQRGYNIILVALPTVELEKTASELENRFGIKTESIAIDLAQDDTPQIVFDKVERLGVNVSILINNAGIGFVGRFEDNPLDYYLQLIKLNAQTTVQMTYLFLPILKLNSQAYIMNMGSLASILPVPYKSVYVASKQFVRGFSLSLCEELRRDGISVTTICPNTVLTKKIHFNRVAKMGWLGGISALKPDDVAQESVDAMFSKKRCIVPGNLNRVVSYCLGLLPYNIMMSIIHHQIQKTLPPLKRI